METVSQKERPRPGILCAITSAEAFLPLVTILRIIGLEPGRYHAWRRAENACELTDRSSCPRTSPGQLTGNEVAAVKEMVLAPEYRHMPLGTLARYGQRIGKGRGRSAELEGDGRGAVRVRAKQSWNPDLHAAPGPRQPSGHPQATSTA